MVAWPLWPLFGHTRTLFGIPLFRSLGTRNVFAATSADQLPQMFAAYLMLGHQGYCRCRTSIAPTCSSGIGANPPVSNGSLMTAPNMRRRLKTLRERGGRVVVIDPRRSETAAVAEHVFIRPGTDVLMLLSLVNVLFEENLVRPGRLGEHLAGERALRAAAAGTRRSERPGSQASRRRRPASWPMRSRIPNVPCCTSRVGACTWEFGGLATWLVLGVNAAAWRLRYHAVWLVRWRSLALALFA